MSVERSKPRSSPDAQRRYPKPPKDDRTKADRWMVARAEEQAPVLFSFKIEPFPETGEDAIAKILVVDRYNVFLQFEHFSAWVAKENVVAFRTWTGEAERVS